MRPRLLLALVALTACGSSQTPPADAKPEPTATATAAVETSAVAVALTAEPVPSQPAEAPVKHPSPLQIGDSSLSTIDIAGIKAGLEKAGYAVIGPEDVVTCGDSETIQLSVTKKGKPMGIFSLQRPAAKPDSCKGASVSESFEMWKKATVGINAKSAMVVDEKGAVLLAVNLMKDESGAAKKLVDVLVNSK